MIDILFQILMAPFTILVKITDFLLPSVPKSNIRQNQNQGRKTGKNDWDKWPPYF